MRPPPWGAPVKCFRSARRQPGAVGRSFGTISFGCKVGLSARGPQRRSGRSVNATYQVGGREREKRTARNS